MQWKETSPGRFERDLDPSEAFFTTLYGVRKPPGRERWALSAVSQFKTDVPSDEMPKALRQAWKEMRYRFPVLGANFNGTSKSYEVPTESALESWLDETILVEPVDADPDTIIGTYTSVDVPKLHYLPGSSQILIHMSHWRTDGIGLVIFTNHLFEALANPREVVFGDEGARLSPSVEEAAAPLCDITDAKKALVREKFFKSQEGGKSIALPIKAYGPAKGTYRKTHVFSESTTAGIVAACKKLGVSVTTVLTAVLTSTVQQLDESEPEERGVRMGFAPIFNLRPYMPAPFKSVDHPLSVMVLGEGINVEVQDFENSIKQISPFYSRNLSLESGSDFIPLVGAWNEFQVELWNTPPPPPPAAASTPATPPKPATTPTLNSMGVLDRYIDHTHKGKHNFEITDYWFATEILGPIILCYVWTFRGRLRLNPVYNEVAFEPEYVQKFLDTFKGNLLAQLQVQE